MRLIGHALLAAIVFCIGLLLVAYEPQDSRGGTASVGTAVPTHRGSGEPVAAASADTAAGIADTRHAKPLESTARTIASPRWVRATLSHYGEGDGYMWQRTSCGKIVTPRSRFVAALKPHLAKCGMRLTILYRGRKYHVRVQDRGAWRSDDRALDAAPGLRRAMRFNGVARIRYRKGWN